MSSIEIPENVTHLSARADSRRCAPARTSSRRRTAPGWAQFFVANGYAVYVVDQVGRGRSNYAQENYGNFSTPPDVFSRYQNWSLQQEYKLFPRGSMHTQWQARAVKAISSSISSTRRRFSSPERHLDLQTVRRRQASRAARRIGSGDHPHALTVRPFGFLIADKRPIS